MKRTTTSLSMNKNKQLLWLWTIVLLYGIIINPEYCCHVQVVHGLAPNIKSKVTLLSIPAPSSKMARRFTIPQGIQDFASSVLSIPKKEDSSSSSSSPSLSFFNHNHNHKYKYKSSLEQWQEYEPLRTSNLDQDILEEFFSKRPHIIAQRLVKVSSTLLRARQQWNSHNHRPTGQGQGQGQREEINNMAEEDDTNFFAAQQQQQEQQVDVMSDSTTDVVSLPPQEEQDRAMDLCSSISSLGPVAVKIGQTLSQRPDLVGHEAAQALQQLQTNNLPYPNEWAYELIRRELNWNGAPLAPDVVDNGLTNPMAQPLFAKMTIDPIACASLGQVYKATLWDGREVAIKVQRPDAMAILAKDMQCFRNVFGTRQKIQQFLDRNSQNNQVEENKQDIGSIIDRVGKDILKELNYTLEAENSVEFQESLSFLGFVTTPDVIHEYSTQHVLVTEWVQGDPLSDLPPEKGLEMTRMAVEACTASMVLTGFMHSDPHEGNLMLHKDGRVVFLDFGLMSRVDEDIMEGFARGIQALLSEDWKTLAESFVDVGFVSDPIMHRDGLNDTWRVDPNFGISELADDLAVAMDEVEGGKARFGSLATVLNKEISPTWLVYTPPYVLLLVRTFLTLEGIAAKVDPNFNIYEMALPWAVKRSLSPSTDKGMNVFRSTIMTPDNRIQWSRFLQLAGPAKENQDSSNDVPGTTTTMETKATDESSSSSSPSQSTQATKDALKAAVASLLGSPEGRPLRRALKDLDSTDLLDQLSSKEGRQIMKTAMTSAMASRKSNPPPSKSLTPPPKHVDSSQTTPSSILARPVSNAFVQMRQRESKRRRQVNRILLWTHFRKQIGLRGVKSTFKFLFAMVRVAASLLVSRLDNIFEYHKEKAG